MSVKINGNRPDCDVVVVGSGPNGLAAALTMQQAGLSVLLLEGAPGVGGGMRTEELTLPGFLHDVCSAVHPLAAISPFFNSLPLEAHGARFIYPDLPAAHPLEDGTAACLHVSLDQTAQAMAADGAVYRKLMAPLLKDWPLIADDLLGPFRIPAHPLKTFRFARQALQSAEALTDRFSTAGGRALWAGMAAHSMQPLSARLTAAIGLVLMAAGHRRGWPVVEGGSGRLAAAMASLFVSLGGKIETGIYVRSLAQLPSSHAVMLDVTPRQLLAIAGHRFSTFYKWQLERYRYGMGVFKVDWALDGPVPFTAEACRKAGTVHLGNTWEEIAASERDVSLGKHPDRPFVLMAQQSLFDPTRAPAGKHTAWAYCHVPHASTRDMTEAVEAQVERFAPGFRERILARHVMDTARMEAYNPNYIGEDINGGALRLSQLFTRPALRSAPYRTSAKGIYICSAATPPGGGVHGLCGYHAARRAWKDIFKSSLSSGKPKKR